MSVELELELDDGAVGALAPLELVEPPAAVSFLVASDDEDALDEDEGGVLGVVVDALEELESFFVVSTVAEPEAEPAGVVVEPDDEDAEPDGVVVRETARSPSLSQPVSIPAPSARDTATAKVVNFI